MTRNVSRILFLAAPITMLACTHATPHSHGASSISSSSSSSTSTSASTGSESHAPLTEAQTVDVLTTIDRAEIDLARLVDARPTSRDAHEMAQMMITQHTDAQAQIDAWARSASTTGQPNEVSRTLVHDVDGIRRQLESASDDTVGHAYLESQIRMHHDALGLIDDRMMPGAHDPAFRDLLTHIRAAVAMHMHHAERLVDAAR